MRREEAAALPDVTLWSLSGLLVVFGHAPLITPIEILPVSTCYIHIAAMLIRSIGAALLTVGAAHGFRGSSPFLMLSTQPYETPLATTNQADV
jgi:hypothetical protein